MHKDYLSVINNSLGSKKCCFNMFNFKWLIAPLILLFSIVGCKKVTEKPGLTGICPKVIATSPSDTATHVSRNTMLTATFNEVMDSATINAATFILKRGSATIPGTVSYTGVTATFIPAFNLMPNTQYAGIITTSARDRDGNALVADYTWRFTTGDSTSMDTTHPIVISTDPANGDTGVIRTKQITATFSEVMNPLTITTASFTLKNGTTVVPGTVAYTGTTAIFAPSALLDIHTVYTATITTAAKDLSGNALLTNYIWSFTTSSVVPSDVTPPTVISTDPVNNATGVQPTKQITATFSEAMNPATINATTFLLKNGAIPISGVVTYSGVTATFSPSALLDSSVVYTATITTGAKDIAGNAVVSNYQWNFTILLPIAVQPPTLGSAAIFGAFGGSAGITNQGINTVINNGSIGTTAASTLITGFHDGITADVYTETPLNVGLVNGRIHTAPPPPGSAASFLIATNALIDANAAYNSISPANKPGGIDPGAGELGGLTLLPGVYKSAGATFKISTGNLTLNANGNPNAVWIFQTAAGLTVGVAGPSGAKSVIMINGGQPKNVYWYVGSAAVINGAGGGVMVGNIIAPSGITFSTAGNATQTVLNGRAISLNASVTMVNTTINVP
jgi:hypothetical protein